MWVFGAVSDDIGVNVNPKPLSWLSNDVAISYAYSEEPIMSNDRLTSFNRRRQRFGRGQCGTLASSLCAGVLRYFPLPNLRELFSSFTGLLHDVYRIIINDLFETQIINKYFKIQIKMLINLEPKQLFSPQHSKLFKLRGHNLTLFKTIIKTIVLTNVFNKHNITRQTITCVITIYMNKPCKCVFTTETRMSVAFSYQTIKPLILLNITSNTNRISTKTILKYWQVEAN